ncbi:MAG: LysR family transcriptional regulator [Thermoanaerobaculia bacterium]
MTELLISSSFRPAAMDVRDLRLVLAIVDSGGLTRASEQLNVTQSALSHQLRQLESALGVELFARIRKRLVLTAAGEELAERARPIVSDISVLEEDLRRRSSGWHGTLRIATECYTLYEWLPPLLQRLHKRHRNVDVRIAAEATSDPLSALQNGTIDLAIITTAPRDRRIATRELFRDELLLIVAPKHPLAQKAFVRPSDLRSERLLLYTPPSENLFHREFFKGAAKSPEVVVMKLTEAMLSMVRANFGVTIAARWAIGGELASGRLAAVRLGARGFRRTWFASTLSPRGRDQPDYVTSFIELLSASRAKS